MDASLFNKSASLPNKGESALKRSAAVTHPTSIDSPVLLPPPINTGLRAVRHIQLTVNCMRILVTPASRRRGWDHRPRRMQTPYMCD